MAIEAVSTTNTNTNRKQSSYLKAGVLGVVGGLAAKYAIPVSTHEYDSFVSQNFIKNHKSLSKKDISNMAKAARSTFDFAVVTALALVTLTLFKNMYNKLADKSK